MIVVLGCPNTCLVGPLLTARSGLNAARKGVPPAMVRRNRAGKRLIFRAWITLKNGTRLYARDYGLKAFALWV